MKKNILLPISILFLAGCSSEPTTRLPEEPIEDQPLEQLVHSTLVAHSVQADTVMVKKSTPCNLSINQLKKRFKPGTQVFTWSAMADTLIRCKKGTVMYLPKGCLQLNGNLSPVQVEIQEYYNFSDFISEELSTIAGNKLLETGGMVYVSIQQNGVDVELKKGGQYALYFPKQEENVSDSMQTFYGARNEAGMVTWRLKTKAWGTKEVGVAVQGTYTQQKGATVDFNQNKMDAMRIAFNEKAMDQIDEAELNYYVLNVSGFGWINCDRFWDAKEQLIDYVVSVDGKSDMNINLIFKDVRSILPAVKIDGNYVFRNVPVNSRVKLVGISYDGNQPAMSVVHTTISQQGYQLNGFRSFTLPELKKELNSL